MITIKYKGKNLNLESGDIILIRNEFLWYKPMRYLSAIVRFFTGVKYNHASMVVVTDGVPLQVEAKLSGVVASNLQDSIERKKSKIIILRRQESNQSTVRTRALNLLGKPYDIPTLIWWQLLYRTLKVWMGPTDGPENLNKLVCTDLVAYAHEFPGYWKFSAKEFLDRIGADLEVVYVEKDF